MESIRTHSGSTSVPTLKSMSSPLVNITPSPWRILDQSPGGYQSDLKSISPYHGEYSYPSFKGIGPHPGKKVLVLTSGEYQFQSLENIRPPLESISLYLSRILDPPMVRISLYPKYQPLRYMVSVRILEGHRSPPLVSISPNPWRISDHPWRVSVCICWEY